MRKYALLTAILFLVLLLAPAALPALAQTSTPTATATSTHTPTATHTATATSTHTTTPVLEVTGVTSNNQGFVVQRSMTAGDLALTLIWLIGIALVVFKLMLDQTERRG